MSYGFPPIRQKKRDSMGHGSFQRLCIAKETLDDRGQGFGILRGAEASHNIALPVDQELGEVPANGSNADDPQEPRLFFLEKAIQGVSVRAVYVDFGEEWEGHAVVLLAEGGDLGFGTGFLGPELV